jgi:hypothetical protein
MCFADNYYQPYHSSVRCPCCGKCYGCGDWNPAPYIPYAPYPPYNPYRAFPEYPPYPIYPGAPMYGSGNTFSHTTSGMADAIDSFVNGANDEA